MRILCHVRGFRYRSDGSDVANLTSSIAFDGPVVVDPAQALATQATYPVASSDGPLSWPAHQNGIVDTVSGSPSTSFSLVSGTAVRGQVEFGGDHDWYRMELVGGQPYTFALNGFGRGALQDPFLRIANAGGTIVSSDDDSGPLSGSRLSFTPATSGTYYVSASGFDSDSIGQYLLTANVGNAAFTPVISPSDIADYLTHSYAEVNGGRAYHWADTSITFNLTALEPERTVLARTALSVWSDVTGLTFIEATGSAQIMFDDNKQGAFANYFGSDGIITSASVNVETSWNGGNDAIDSYTFQTFIHEIGHALGLGHAGPYNGSATYGIDNVYANDSWQYTVMSYMDQDDFGGASRRFTMTPMMADILAVSNLYGYAHARTGDTVYGFGSTAGAIYDFSRYSLAPALTIYDSGGIDTLNAAGYSANQTIDIGAGNFCSIGGLSNNVCVYLTSIIENAAGGNGNDIMRGNSAANLLEGNGGNDTLDGADGDDVLRGGAGNDTLRGGAGIDIAFYSVSSSSASWSSRGSETWTVTSAEGVDTLLEIDTLVFVDRTISLAENAVGLIEDGIDDVLYRNSSGLTGTWILDATGVNEAASRTYGTIELSRTIEGDGDFNGDGNLDLLVREPNGVVRTLCLDSTGVNGSESRVLASPNSGTNFVAGDFNGDGRDDLAWQQPNGEFGFWIVDSSGINGSASRAIGSSPNLEIVGSGDFNADQIDDLLWRDSSNSVGTLVLDHTGVNGGASRVLGTVVASTEIEGIGDFNADGISDLVLQAANGQVVTWIVDSSGLNGGASGVLITTSSDIAGVGDFNDDGVDDLLWRDGANNVGVLLIDHTGINGGASHTVGTLGPGVEIVGLGDVNGGWLV